MIESKLIGRYLQFANGLKNDESIGNGPYGSFITQLPILNSIQKSTLVTQNINFLNRSNDVYLNRPNDVYSTSHKFSNVVNVENRDIRDKWYHKVQSANNRPSHRVFQWLNFSPGYITQVALNGIDVLTGFMGGCWLMKYRRNGIVYIGHVGTSLEKPLLSTYSKDAWNKFSREADFDVIGGFKPRWRSPLPLNATDDEHNNYIKGLRVDGERGGVVQTLGLVTANEGYYTLLVCMQTSGYDQNRGQQNPPYRIIGVQQDYSATPFQLENI